MTRVRPIDEPIELSPKQFELEVKAFLKKANGKLKKFDAKHLEKIRGREGEYEIDITVRFEALGVNYLTLVECKHQKNPIKREVVQILHDKIHEVGAHKGMIFATTTFQRGAIEYATANGIALIKMVEEKALYVTKAFGVSVEPPLWANVPPCAGYFVSITDEGHELRTLISVRHTEKLNEFLGF